MSEKKKENPTDHLMPDREKVINLNRFLAERTIDRDALKTQVKAQKAQIKVLCEELEKMVALLGKYERHRHQPEFLKNAKNTISMAKQTLKSLKP